MRNTELMCTLWKSPHPHGYESKQERGNKVSQGHAGSAYIGLCGGRHCVEGNAIDAAEVPLESVGATKVMQRRPHKVCSPERCIVPLLPLPLTCHIPLHLGKSLFKKCTLHTEKQLISVFLEQSLSPICCSDTNLSKFCCKQSTSKR